MKKLLTLLFVVQFHFIYSQPLVQENKTWNVAECMNFGGCGTQSFLLSGDTTIGEFVYKKLYITTDTIEPTWYLLGAMRENEDMVYYHDFTTESVFYDFNLQVGDTFSTVQNFYGDCYVEMEVEKIDTVTLFNGEERERITFKYFADEWIKGIGSVNGLVYVNYWSCIIDMWYELSCCHENNELVYLWTKSSSCYVNSVGIKENKQVPVFIVFPNPNNGAFQIQLKQQENLTFQKLTIYNLEGKAVFVSENPELLQSEIKLPSLPDGIYFAQLAFRENTYSVKFLIRVGRLFL
jgi:bifunctional DNase/RNase